MKYLFPIVHGNGNRRQFFLPDVRTTPSIPTCCGSRHGNVPALRVIAGHETTVNLIGNGTPALLEYPKQFSLRLPRSR